MRLQKMDQSEKLLLVSGTYPGKHFYGRSNQELHEWLFPLRFP